MRTQRYWSIVLLAWLGSAASASAHFLFIRILPPAAQDRHAEVYFSDHADAGDARFIANIAHTALWLQDKPGKFQPLKVEKATDRLRATVPSDGTFSVIGECTYGVLGLKKTPFLLRHYPKAVAGRAEEIGKLAPKKEIPFEIQIAAQAGGVQFVALRNGKPVPRAGFTSVAADLQNTEFTADEHGKGHWKPSKPGYYAVYVSQTLKEKGAHQGTKYDEIREFTTVAFTWPLLDAVGTWSARLDDKDPTVRRAAARALGEIGPDAKTALPALIVALKDDDRFVRFGATKALGKIGPAAAKAAPALAETLRDKNEFVRSLACDALGKIGKAAVPSLVKVLQSPGEDARARAAKALAKIGPDAKEAAPALAQALTDPDRPVRVYAAEALARTGERHREALATLVDLLKNDDAFIRHESVLALGSLGPQAKSAAPALASALADPDAFVRDDAAVALRKIDPEGAKPTRAP